MQNAHYYKVVAVKGNKRMSCVTWRCDGDIGLFYWKKKWTWPKIEKSLLFVFDSLRAAKEFVRDEESTSKFPLQIWESQVYGKAKELRTRCRCVDDENAIKLFWESNVVPLSTKSVPEGTYGARAVKLIRRIT